jgi:hypothetical protein
VIKFRTKNYFRYFKQRQNNNFAFNSANKNAFRKKRDKEAA